MMINTVTLRGGLVATGLSLAALLGACETTGDTETTDSQSTDTAGDAQGGDVGIACTVGDKTYAPGDSFPSDDGCNTCSCGADGQVACTLMACQVTCDYGGATYPAGDSFPSTDGCNTCSCESDGQVSCTLMACITECVVGGTTYQPGETWAADCNTCTCEEDGSVSCTEMACPMPCVHEGVTYAPGDVVPWGDGCSACTCQETGTIACDQSACGTCVHEGQSYGAGDSFPAGDGCNTCTCQEDGSVACTLIACAAVCDHNGRQLVAGQVIGAGDGCGKCECEADATVDCAWPVTCTCEPVDGGGLDYIGASVDICAVIDFACPAGTTHFQNECGCGCEQSPACPDEVDCATETAQCSDPSFAAGCPYTTLLNAPPPACCGADADCGPGWVCGGGAGGMGVCKLPAEGDACWSDGECAEGSSCVGAFTCPCNADCDGWDEPGTCKSEENECTKDADCQSGQCIAGPVCLDWCLAGDPACCYGNVCAPEASECTKDADCPSGQCIAGPLCSFWCEAGDPACCYGNTCAPSACGPLPPKGCSSDGQCTGGAKCVIDGACHASVCGCNPEEGLIMCTADCQPGSCQAP